MLASISGLGAFLAYFATAALLVAAYLVVYMLATAHDELALIRGGVTSAAVALGGSLVAFALPLAVAIYNAQTLLDCAVWGLIALVVQMLVYWAVRLALPNLSGQIAAGETAPAVFLAAASLAAGILDAASMTY
jgi:putative membrane protein